MMSAGAIEEYERMVMALGQGDSEEFRVWMGKMILYCDAQDVRLE